MPEPTVLSKNPPAKTPSAQPPAPPNLGRLQWRTLSIVGGVLLVLWVAAALSHSTVFLVVVGVLSVAIVGVVGWAWRWMNKQREMMQLLQGATASPQARKEALAKLAARSDADTDVMNAVARAQLEAQDDPDKALVTLEAIDLKKAPVMLVDEVRAFRAQLYLMKGRAREARDLADDIKVTNAQQPEARAMLAATVAEAWARTGKHKEAMDLLATMKPEDPAYGQARVPLLFARIYAAFAAGQRDQVRRDMNALIKQDMNLLARFVMPQAKVHPELQKMAREALARDPEVRKMAQRQGRVVRRR